MDNNNISFKMKFDFVNGSAFEKIKGGTYIDWKPPHKVISKYKELSELGLGSLIKRQDVVLADEFKTYSVRTCEGGLTKNSQDKRTLGFHYFDDETNYNTIGEFLKLIFNLNPNPDSAVLIGGKNLLGSKYSIPNMNIFMEVFKIKIPKLTYFCDHAHPYSETDFHYSQKDDKMTICSMFRPQKEALEHYVSSIDDLRNCYRKIHMADGDVLMINGKEVDSAQFKTNKI